MEKYNIYTSYFKLSAKLLNTLSIVPKTPPWYVMGKATELLCSKELYNDCFKKRKYTEEEFTQIYTEEILSKQDPYEILKKYNNKILLGWYKEPSFDARFVFSKWIKDTTGIIIPEATKEYIKSLEVERI